MNNATDKTNCNSDTEDDDVIVDCEITTENGFNEVVIENTEEGPEDDREEMGLYETERGEKFQCLHLYQKKSY